MTPIVLAITLVQFTGPTGARIDLNPDAITSIRDPGAMPEGHWSKGTHCIIVVDGGGAVAVTESCDQVRQAVGGK